MGLTSDIEEIAPTMDALEEWMKERGDLPDGANGWRDQCIADPKTVETAVAFVRIARGQAADELPALRERVEAIDAALTPFAKAAEAVAEKDPEFPMDGAALRASFDWYVQPFSVRRSDLEHARAILAQQGGEVG